MLLALLLMLDPGQAMPPLEGNFLSGRKAVLPTAAQGRVALVALGFTYDSRHAVESWTKRFRKEFSGQPRVTFFEVPMLGGAGRLGKWFIEGGMRRNTPKENHENVITVYSNVDSWKKEAGFQAPDDAYLFLIDPQGVVRWKYHGKLDEAAFGALAGETRVLAK
ncbi:MAG: hypothetical protein U0Q16_22750 [Bryobacteraceae bacterium]